MSSPSNSQSPAKPNNRKHKKKEEAEGNPSNDGNECVGDPREDELKSSNTSTGDDDSEKKHKKHKKRKGTVEEERVVTNDAPNDAHVEQGRESSRRKKRARGQDISAGGSADAGYEHEEKSLKRSSGKHEDESTIAVEKSSDKKNKKRKKVKQVSNKTSKNSNTWSDEDLDLEDDDDMEQIEGFVFEGVLLLRDIRKGIIFSSQRNADGERLAVGTWGPDGKHEFSSYQWKLPQEAENEDNAPRDPLKFQVTDPADHCETGPRAYSDIKDALETISTLIDGVDRPADLLIWDPFFCTGRMITHMINIGFPRVHNKNEDFYQVKLNPPKHHVLMTNPPYSRDHIPRLLEYCMTLSTPCFLLLPSWVGKKSYFTRFDNADSRYFFLVPKSGRYTYHNPGLNGAKVGRTAPFQSFWYISAKVFRSEVLRQLTVLANKDETPWELYKSINRVPERFFDAADGW